MLRYECWTGVFKRTAALAFRKTLFSPAPGPMFAHCDWPTVRMKCTRRRLPSWNSESGASRKRHHTDPLGLKEFHAATDGGKPAVARAFPGSRNRNHGVVQCHS